MSAEDNKAIVRRFYEEVFNQRNLAVVDELCITNHLFHNPPTTLQGERGVQTALVCVHHCLP